MKAERCCENPRPRTFVRRCIDVIGWIVPSVILGLLPECPACLAAYVAVWTGIGLSFSAATRFAGVVADSVCRIDFTSGNEKRASPASQIWSLRKNNQEERSMLKASKAFSGFS